MRIEYRRACRRLVTPREMADKLCMCTEMQEQKSVIAPSRLTFAASSPFFRSITTTW